MRKPLLLAFAALTLAACNQTPAPEAAAPVTETPAEVAPTPPPAPAAHADSKPLVDKLPGGVDFPFPYHAVYDRLVDLEQNKKQRRVLVEFLEGDVAGADGHVSAMMQQAGFRRAKPKDEKGGIRVNYSRKEDGSRVTVLILPAEGQKMRSAGGKGTVYIGWIEGTQAGG